MSSPSAPLSRFPLASSVCAGGHSLPPKNSILIRFLKATLTVSRKLSAPIHSTIGSLAVASGCRATSENIQMGESGKARYCTGGLPPPCNLPAETASDCPRREKWSDKRMRINARDAQYRRSRRTTCCHCSFSVHTNSASSLSESTFPRPHLSVVPGLKASLRSSLLFRASVRIARLRRQCNSGTRDSASALLRLQRGRGVLALSLGWPRNCDFSSG